MNTLLHLRHLKRRLAPSVGFLLLTSTLMSSASSAGAGERVEGIIGDIDQLQPITREDINYLRERVFSGEPIDHPSLRRDVVAFSEKLQRYRLTDVADYLLKAERQRYDRDFTTEMDKMTSAMGLDALRYPGTTLWYYDRDGQRSEMASPVGGQMINDVAESCLYRSGGVRQEKANITSDTIILGFNGEPKPMGVLFQRGKDEWVQQFDVSHVAFTWGDTRDVMRIGGQIYGTLSSKPDTDPAWYSFSCDPRHIELSDMATPSENDLDRWYHQMERNAGLHAPRRR